MNSRAILCEYAWLGGNEVQRNVLIEIRDGRIAAVTRAAGKSTSAVYLRGLTLPGFANAHSHVFQRALRGRTHGAPMALSEQWQPSAGVRALNFWSWRDQMYSLAAKLEPDTLYALARAVYGEMLLSGITCVGEFHYVHHPAGGGRYANPNEMGVVLLKAAAEAGVRITLLDTCYLNSAPGLPLLEEQVRFSDATAANWAERVEQLTAMESGSVRIGAAVHSVRAVDPDSIRDIAEWSRRKNMVLHAHVSEQPGENEQSINAFAITPTQLLANAGALGRHFTAVHATHLSNHDIALLGRSNSHVCFCPTTERDLADGIGPSAALAAAGASISLGSDSHAVVDMLEETRALELNERLASLNRCNHPISGLLSSLTVNGHASLGWVDAGSITVGQLADLVSLDMNSVRTAGGTEEDLLPRAIFAATASDIHHVVVSGRTVVQEGRHLHMDVAAELTASISAVI